MVLWTTAHAISALGRDHARARALIDRSLALNPNSAEAWCISGWNHNYVGNGAAGLAAHTDFQRAIRLSPFDPMRYYFYTGMSSSYMNLQRYDLTVHWAEKALRERPNYGSTLRQARGRTGLFRSAGRSARDDRPTAEGRSRPDVGHRRQEPRAPERPGRQDALPEWIAIGGASQQVDPPIRRLADWAPFDPTWRPSLGLDIGSADLPARLVKIFVPNGMPCFPVFQREIPCSLKKIPCYGCKNSLFRCVGNLAVTI